MKWRWIIRGLGIALLTLSVTAWVGSHWETLGIWRAQGNHFVVLELRRGEILFESRNEKDANFSPPWLWIHQDAQKREDNEENYRSTKFHFWGFAYDPVITDTSESRPVLVPIWFPTLLSTLLLCLVWRKTRPKYSGKGFPVEVAKTEARKA